MQGTSEKKSLKHKDSYGKSENLSKTFFTEIVVFHLDYECKLSSSNDLLWISFIWLKKIILELFGRPPNKPTHVMNYTLKGIYYEIVNLTSVQNVKFVWKYFV